MDDRHDFDDSEAAASVAPSRAAAVPPTGTDGSDPAFRDAERLIRDLLGFLGEDPQREGLLRTPERVVRALRFLTEGYRQDVDNLFNDAYFTEEYDEMVLVRDIEFYSLCEHHLLPFFGKVHVAYLPRRRIVGLSKIPRLVDFFARRLQVQERMTKEIAGMMMERLDPLGVGVVVEARHLCMVMRGVEKQHSTMTTSHMVGRFRDHQPTRLEFMNLISGPGA